MLKGFRDFILRGNVIDLAVAVIIGAAFSGLVDAVVKGFVEPLLAFIVGKPNFDDALVLGPLRFGLIVTALINFLLKAAVVYFVILSPVRHLLERLKRRDAQVAAAAPPAAEVVLLTEIRDLLKTRGPVV